jgi:acetyltransferase-like isoleucine patch superfamily enzyme
MSKVAWGLGKFQRPWMVYGYYDRPSRKWRKFTRVSSSAILMNRAALSMGDGVWVWHYSILDATAGLTIEEGCQIGAWVGIFTHGSQDAIRLLGKQFVHIPNAQRAGYTRASVTIGAYSFLGAGCRILPGVRVGKGCLVGTGSLVTDDLADYSIAVGSPARVIGSTVDLDLSAFRERDFSSTYYDATALALIRQRIPGPAG